MSQGKAGLPYWCLKLLLGTYDAPWAKSLSKQALLIICERQVVNNELCLWECVWY